MIVVSYLAVGGVLSEETHEEDVGERGGKVLSVFNVVTFPNSACGASNGYNGTCYTASECTAKGGTASGTCASSFGVCCVFSIACGGTSSANNSYAIISSYSTSSDADPCTYTFCKTSSDVCKLRIDFDTMELSKPTTLSSTVVATDSWKVGYCHTDSLTITNPGGTVPPIICGYNTGQHMFITASDQCNQINIDIDTGSTSTTRKWQIKVTQYECGNMMAPEQDCLQYLTSQTGTIASFNWDTSASSVASSQVHLTNQNYDICIRRTRGYCSVCYDPVITTTTASFGLSSVSADGPTLKSSVEEQCLGITEINPTAASSVAMGDYLEIAALQPGTGTSTTVVGVSRICGVQWNANPSNTETSHATACSYSVPFRVGVHFDELDIIQTSTIAAIAGTMDAVENVAASSNSGIGYQGFYLNYWQNSC